MREKQYSGSYYILADEASLRRRRRAIYSLSCKNEVDSYICDSQLHPIQQLPVNLLPLIGREQEREDICALLQQPQVRLLTLVGMGGVGKTRLALQVYSEVLSTFTDGACFVSLASTCTCDMVLPTIAQALGLHERSDYSPVTQIQTALQDRKFLLLLDNFEQVVDAAPQLKELLAACPDLKILITSRIVLKVLEEHVFYVAPLALPDLAHLPPHEELSQVASVCLFLQRVRAIYPEFEITGTNAPIIAQICVRLDGLPLALELAAARIKLFSPQSLLARLEHRLSFLAGGPRDAPERQQTLRKAIEWSYHLLTSEEQCLFRRLSVFADGCTLQAIEAISTTTDTRGKLLLDTLTALLDQSLLRREAYAGNQEQRFTMLETIREYALECLQASDEEEMIRQAHAEYYLDLARALELQVSGEEMTSWIAWIESEFENLRTAFRWLFSSQDAEQSHATSAQLPVGVCLVGMGISVATHEHYAWAASLWGKANTFVKRKAGLSEAGPCERLTTTLNMHPLYSQAIKTVRTELGEQTFNSLWKKGQSMTLEHALAEPEPHLLSMQLSPPAKVSKPYSDELTSREREVLCLLSQGLSSALIARQLVISLTTVNSHIRTIYNKLGVSCRSAATRYAIEHHLV